MEMEAIKGKEQKEKRCPNEDGGNKWEGENGKEVTKWRWRQQMGRREWKRGNQIEMETINGKERMEKR
ncbi:hypothetical protein BALCAV_0222035 [Alkalihalobacillus alcalophilus ATCC 27647 = CGMCC 1.3604]|uniref:Uncharacterized protein n=1 Tax=Alkalihalobacillus alcalophilus ATCC 27647 = CGMCC 1.3604 TaxID=1218173 RepID=A0A094X9S5_ALKAL|nr:hypothetical protein [Alkalihalobacillus alcalophilus]KGA95525.1 hypothetical protein BALCAV_0222035 [Alkalihalobacillus alcalophilus ATCC 27647 = CGMCC 1.3604]